MPKPKSAKFDAIVILGTMRTGSNLLERIMTQNTKIIGTGELFNPNFIFRRTRTDYHGIDIATRNIHPDLLLEKAINVNAPRLPLFRFFPEHTPAALPSILLNPRIAKVILKRNPIDSFISYEIAKANAQWILTRRKKDVAEVSFEFDMDTFWQWKSEGDGFYDVIDEALQSNGQTGFEIEYDNIKNLGLLDELADFLELGENWPFFVEPLTQQNPKPRKNYLKNPEILQSPELPQWQPRAITNRPPEPIISHCFWAKNLNLIYVPIFGNGTSIECQHLETHNQEPLQKIKTSKLASHLKSKPELQAYTRILPPIERIHTIFMKHILGETNGFDQEFPIIARNTMEAPIKGLAKAPNWEALSEIGLKNERVFKKFLRNFIIEIRKELWSGFRDHLISDQYWPQFQITQNLQSLFPMEILIGRDFPNQGAFAPLCAHSVPPHPYLLNPLDTNAELQDKMNVQIFDLYQEDFEHFGFEIDL